MLAKHWHKFNFDIRVFAFPISLDPNPIDGSALCRFLFAGDTDIIFSMTRHDACFTPRTPVQVDHHFPFIGFP
jgi:hypothetical protein